jgi:hypothetical protein
MTTTEELTPFELETQFKQMTLRELCFEAAQIAEIMENSPPDELMIQLRSRSVGCAQSWLSEATEEKVDGYAWAASYLNLEIDQWQAKKAKLMEMCDAIITRKEFELNAMKEGLLRLNSLGLIPDYLLGKTKAIEIRQNSRPRVTLNLPPSDRDFPTRFRYQRTEWLADKDAIVAAYEAGEDLSAIATVEIGYQVRFKNAPKHRKKSK